MRKILFADSHYFDEYVVVGQRQYALQFADHDWDTAIITNPLSPFNTIFSKDKRAVYSHLLNHIKNGTKVRENLWYYVPFTFIPFHNRTIFERQWFLDNYHRFTVPSIRSVIESRGFSSVDILWLGTANQKFWRDILDYKCCIYRLSDNNRAWSTSNNILMKAEEDIMESSDLIIITSMVLLEQWKDKYGDEKFIYSPNGVDLSNFIRDQYNRPKEYSDIVNRIALYVGAIGEWFDEELLRNVATLCPETTFVIIGVDECGKMKTLSEENIYYLGPRDYKDLPDYIYYCDCGIIPFNNSKLVQSICPIKMYEFFSLGKPVISRAWRELKLLNSPCFLANNATEFADFLRDKNTFSINPKKLLSYAYDNTWRKRYLKIVRTLEDHGI